MTTQINNIFTSVFKQRNFTSSFDRGEFSITNRANVTMDHAGNQFNGDVHLRTDFSTANHEVELIVDDMATDVQGVNQTFIHADGYYQPAAALAEFRQTAFGRHVINADNEAKVYNMTHRDSHEMFLFNMMQSVVIAQVAKQNGVTKKKKDGIMKTILRASAYKSTNTHNAVNERYTNEYSLELGPPRDAYQTTNLHKRTAENYFDKEYVLHYKAGSDAQEAFYLSHLYGREGRSQLNVDFPLPDEGRNKHFLLDRVRASSDSVPSLDGDEVDWSNADQLFLWVKEYVAMNRLDHAFAAVMDTIGSIHIHPIYPSVEATQWQHATIQVTLPSFSPTRARLKINIEEKPYVTRPKTISFSDEQEVDLHKALVIHAVHNYAMWLGIWSIATEFTRSGPGWTLCCATTHKSMTILDTTHFRAAMLSHVFGKEVDSFMHGSCGMRINICPMADIFTTDQEDSVGNNLYTHYDRLAMPVTGSLLMGYIAGSAMNLRHLTGVQTISFNDEGGNYYSEDHAVQVANAYQLLGNAIEVTRYPDLEQFTPWAPENECCIEASQFYNVGTISNYYSYNFSERREGRSHMAPQLAEVLRSGTLYLTIGLPSLTLSNSFLTS